MKKGMNCHKILTTLLLLIVGGLHFGSAFGFWALSISAYLIPAWLSIAIGVLSLYLASKVCPIKK